MTSSVYVLGGAGSGKSTFTAELLRRLGAEMGPLADLKTRPNAKGTPVTLRGHHLSDGGLYIGCMRDSFPGTDGLDRASSISGEAWLWDDEPLPRYVLAEGATLATRRFLTALHARTALLVVHLRVDPMIADLRFLQRGSNQDPGFVQATVTRSANRAEEMVEAGAYVVPVDTAEEDEWSYGLRVAEKFLSETTSILPDHQVESLL